MRATDLPLGHTVRLSTMMRFAVRACVGVALCAGSATAQLREVQAYQAVVTTATPMRSGDSQRFYSVLDLKSGDVVTVDAESAEWARIAYPPGGSAFIRADQAELGPTGQSVKLKVESKLLSVNPEHGLSGSWKSLLPDAAKPGAEFKLIDVIKEKDAVLGYRIAAPAEARGFVLARALRRATQAEIDAAKTLSAGTLPSATSAPAPRNTATPAGATTAGSTNAREVPATMPTMGPNGQPAMTTSISVAPEERPATSTPPATSTNSAASTPAAGTAPASTPNTATPAAAIPPTATPPAATGTPPASIDLTRPQQPTGQAPPASTESPNPAAPSTTEITQSTSGAAPASAAGESAPAVGVTTDATADASTPTEPQADAASVGEMEAARPPLPSTAEDLEPLFQAVRRQDVMNAEIDELLTQYETLISRRPVGDRRRRVLEQRAEILRLMQDYRNERRTLEEANAAARAVTDDMSRRFAQYDVQRQYAIVGVLTPSSVYDGTRLPLMYRLQSIGGSVPRTLGYIKPREDLNLPSKIGVVVGVVGEQNVDSSLRLNVIDPVRVDPLRAAENPVRVQP